MLIIGEKINASIKSVGEALSKRNEDFLTTLARDQVAAGADVIDVNAGVGQDATESATTLMEWLIDLIQEATDKPLCIDSDDPAIIDEIKTSLEALGLAAKRKAD